MRRTLFDWILLGFLVLSLATFGILFFYTSYSSNRMLINEKQETM